MKAYMKYIGSISAFSLAVGTVLVAFDKHFQQLRPWAERLVPDAIEAHPVLCIAYVFITAIICATITVRTGSHLADVPTRYDDNRSSDDRPPI